VNAFQVATAEIEAVCSDHPAVLDCAVFGVPDERAGEVPAAAVQLDESRPVAEGELERLVADALRTYKHLRHLVVVDTVPRLRREKFSAGRSATNGRRHSSPRTWRQPWTAAPDARTHPRL